MADKKPIIIDSNGDLLKMQNGDTVALANGGTGQTTANNALNALLPSQTSNSGKYLTTNGTNTSWADVSSSGGISIFDATVGASGADYTTLGAAITAGKTRILVIDDTTETGDITLPSNCIIEGIGREAVTIDMATYQFLDNTAANDNFTFKNLGFRTAITSGRLFPACNKMYWDNIYVDASSATYSSFPIFMSANNNTNNIFLQNVYLDLPDQNNSGISIYYGSIENVYINGGGSNCRGAIYITYASCKNAVIKGTWSSSYAAISANASSTLSNVTSTITAIIGCSTNSTCTNINGSFLSLDVGASDATVSNCIVKNFLPNIDGDDNLISNVKCLNGGGTISSGGDRNQFSNCQIYGTITISGNDTTMTGCRVGADASGGSNTITIASGANRTIISGCRTDAAISDSGTDTVGIGNVVY